MREMTLREVQLFGLEILKDVHRFCILNDIKYSLAYGTLIGAIRHKGFIPWDDDIDIIMPRPDYERFCKTFTSVSGFSIFSPVLGNCYLGYSRVCDLKKTWVHSMPWCHQSPSGMWIDIFPIDGIDINRNSDEDFQNLSNLESKRYKARIPMDNIKRPMPFKRLIRTLAKKVIFCRSNIQSVVSLYENYIKDIDLGSSEYCGNRAILAYYKKELYPRKLFESYVDVEFEGFSFKAVAGYDELLRTIYGDYMQLPPVEKRVRHPQEMYWI